MIAREKEIGVTASPPGRRGVGEKEKGIGAREKIGEETGTGKEIGAKGTRGEEIGTEKENEIGEIESAIVGKMEFLYFRYAL